MLTNLCRVIKQLAMVTFVVVSAQYVGQCFTWDTPLLPLVKYIFKTNLLLENNKDQQILSDRAVNPRVGDVHRLFSWPETDYSL